LPRPPCYHFLAMDLNAYHNAWMQGHKESECVRIGEEAYFENQRLASNEREHYAELEREHYAELEREHYAELEREHLEEMKAQAKPSPDNAKDGGSSLRDSVDPVVEGGAK
jgi:hypothetical protein